MTIGRETMVSPVNRKLAVSIVNYNTWDDTARCVHSILDTFDPDHSVDLEVLVWDNGTELSPDGFGDGCTQLHVGSASQNVGFGRGHNNNVATAENADLVLILNPDTVVAWADVMLLIADLDENVSTVAVAPQLRQEDGTVEFSCRRLPTIITELARISGIDSLGFGGTLMTEFDHATRVQVQQPPGAALLIKGNSYRRIGGFDEMFPLYFDDVDLCARLSKIGTIEYAPRAVFIHRREGTAKRFRAKSTFWIEYSRRIYIHKYFSPSVATILCALGGLGLLLRCSVHMLVSWGKAGHPETRLEHVQKARGYGLAFVSGLGGSRSYWLRRMLEE